MPLAGLRAVGPLLFVQWVQTEGGRQAEDDSGAPGDGVQFPS